MYSKRYLSVNVDRSLLPDYSKMAGVSVPDGLAKDVKDSGVVEEKYWYYTEDSAAAYIALVDDDYATFANSRNCLHNNLTDIIEKITNMIDDDERRRGKSGKVPRINLIALGMGSADKEHDIFRRILQDIKRYKFKFDVRFTPVDFSYPLMMHGINKTLKEFASDLENNKFELVPYVVDFTKCQRDHLVDHDDYTLITALGIVYNSAIPLVFKYLRNLMTEKTRLLIDAEMVDERSKDKLLEGYENREAQEFIRSPISILGKAYKKMKAFPDKYDIETYKDFAEADEAEVEAEVIDKDTIEEFIESHNLKEGAKSKIMISPDEGSKTIAQTITVGEQDYVLGFTTRFVEAEFIKTMEIEGLELVGSWEYAKTHTKYFMLKLGSGESTITHDEEVVTKTSKKA